MLPVAAAIVVAIMVIVMIIAVMIVLEVVSVLAVVDAGRGDEVQLPAFDVWRGQRIVRLQVRQVTSFVPACDVLLQ